MSSVCDEHTLNFRVYHCYRNLRSYGDNGIAVFFFSTFGACVQAMLLAWCVYMRTCVLEHRMLRVMQDHATRVSLGIYFSLCAVPVHLIVVFPSLLHEYVHAPQLSFGTVVQYTVSLWLQCALLVIALLLGRRFNAYLHSVLVLHFATLLLVVSLERLRVAEFSYDCAFPVAGALALIVPVLHVNQAMRIDQPRWQTLIREKDEREKTRSVHAMPKNPLEQRLFAAAAAPPAPAGNPRFVPYSHYQASRHPQGVFVQEQEEQAPDDEIVTLPEEPGTLWRRLAAN